MHMPCMSRKLNWLVYNNMYQGNETNIMGVAYQYMSLRVLQCIYISACAGLLTALGWSAFDLCPLPEVTPPTGRRCLCCRRYQPRLAQTAHQTLAVPHLHSSQRRWIHTQGVVAAPVQERERERERVCM